MRINHFPFGAENERRLRRQTPVVQQGDNDGDDDNDNNVVMS